MEIRKLNMLRGLAALLVMLSHYSNNTNILNGVLGHNGGQFGVMLFFILSGFLMSYLYINRPFSREAVYKFAVARFARVVPLFVLVVLVSFILPRLGLPGIFYDIMDVPSLVSHFLLMSGNSVLWTISPEIQFYVLFVFFWWLFARRPGYLYTLSVVIFVCLVLLHFPSPDWRVFGLALKLKLVSSIQYFLAGIILGQLYGHWQAPDYLRKHVFVLAFLILPLLYPDIYKMLTGFEHALWQDAGVFIVVCVVFFAMVFLVPDDNVLLNNPIGDYLGKISYSLYLLHLPVLYFLIPPAKQQPFLFLPVFIISAVLVASLSFYLIENPTRKKLRAIL